MANDPDDNVPQLRVAYLCLQTTAEGQAAYAHVHEIVENLRAIGWTVRLSEPQYRLGSRPTLLERIVEYARVQWRLWRWDAKPDVIYIRNHYAALPTALIAWMRRIPVVQEVNGPYEDLFIAYPWTRRAASLFTAMMRIQLRLANGVVAVTKQLGEWAVAVAGDRPVAVIPNGVNTELFFPGALTCRDLPPRFVVFFGALAAWQGIDTALEAVEHPEWPAGVSLVIVGDGALKDRVQQVAARSPIVQPLGRLRYHDVAGVVCRSLAALSPQHDLGGRARTGLFPLKLFEALACGVPVIVTDFPGQADLVRQHGVGLVIPERDPGELARAVGVLAGDSVGRERMGRRGAEVARQHFSWRRRAEQTAAFLARLPALREQLGESSGTGRRLCGQHRGESESMRILCSVPVPAPPNPDGGSENEVVPLAERDTTGMTAE